MQNETATRNFASMMVGDRVKIELLNKLLAGISISLLLLSAIFLALDVKKKKDEAKIRYVPSVEDTRRSDFEDWLVFVNYTKKFCIVASKEKNRITNQGSDVAVNYREGAFGAHLGEVNNWNWRFMFNNDRPILDGHSVIVQLNHENREPAQYNLENYKDTAAVTPTDKMGFEIFRNFKPESWVNVAIKNSFGATDILYISGEGFWEASEHCYKELESEIYSN